MGCITMNSHISIIYSTLVILFSISLVMAWGTNLNIRCIDHLPKDADAECINIYNQYNNISIPLTEQTSQSNDPCVVSLVPPQ